MQLLEQELPIFNLPIVFNYLNYFELMYLIVFDWLYLIIFINLLIFLTNFFHMNVVKSLMLKFLTVHLGLLITFSRCLDQLLYDLIVVSVLAVFSLLLVVGLFFPFQESQPHIIRIDLPRSRTQGYVTMISRPLVEYPWNEIFNVSVRVFFVRFCLHRFV